MNILVCISKVPDTTSKIGFTEGDTKFDMNGIQFIINPYDEWYALVRALELKEANGGEVTVINVGLADTDSIIRKALAIGADKAVRIDAEPQDSFFVAKQIATFADGKGYDMILCGKETIDYNSGMVPGMIAELMNLPFSGLATKLDMSGSTAIVIREVTGGTETIEIEGSFVLSAAKGMAEQRIPNMRGIMMARKKPLEVVAPAGVEANTSVANYKLPPVKTECKMVDADNPAELIRLLREEAKVI